MDTHFGTDSFPSLTHKGRREDCSHPDCAWPRMGDWVSGMAQGVERTGELVDFHIIRTSCEDEYVISGSTLRKPERGAFYCPHGVKIVEADPSEAESDDAPIGRMVEPWPCTTPDCTRERFEAAVEADIEEYWDGINDLMRTQYE